MVQSPLGLVTTTGIPPAGSKATANVPMALRCADSLPVAEPIPETAIKLPPNIVTMGGDSHGDKSSPSVRCYDSKSVNGLCHLAITYQGVGRG